MPTCVRSMTVVLSATAAAALAPAAARADDAWANPAGGSWGTAANWSAGVPTGAAATAFNLGTGSAYAVTLPAAESFGTLDVGSGAVTVTTNGYLLDSSNDGVGTAVAVAPAAGQTASLTVVSAAGSYGGLGSYVGWNVGLGGTVNLVGGHSGTGSVGAISANGGAVDASAGAVVLAPDGNATAGGTISADGSATNVTFNTAEFGGVAGQAGSLSVTNGATFSVTADAAVGASAYFGSVPPSYGAGGTGTLAVSGGRFFGGALLVGTGTVGSGTVAVSDGGTIAATTTLAAGGGSATLTATGVGTACTGSLTIADGGVGRATFAAGATLAGVIDVGLDGGNGSLTLSGLGTTLAATDLNVGRAVRTTTVYPGGTTTQALSGAGTGLVRLAGGATATATDTASGSPAVDVYAGGTLQLASAATLVDAGGYAQAGALAIELDPANAAGPDLTVAGLATLGGPLSVTLGAGVVPAAGQTYDLFTFAAEAGAFSSVSLPPLPPGLSWDLSRLYSAGEITAVPEPAVVPVAVAAVGAWVGRRRRYGRPTSKMLRRTSTRQN